MPVPMLRRRFYNLRPMIGRRFGATGCRRYLTTWATTSAQFTVDITPEGRKPEQQSDGSVKRDLPSNQIESGSAAMEVSTREFLDDYLSLAQRSSLWSRSRSHQAIAPIEQMPHSCKPSASLTVRIAINTNRFHSIDDFSFVRGRHQFLLATVDGSKGNLPSGSERSRQPLPGHLPRASLRRPTKLAPASLSTG
jgi:hypothetical protein